MNARQKPRKTAVPRTGPSPEDVHDVVYFKRHRDDDATESAPGRDFLNSTCPAPVRATLRAVLADVAAAPPMRFSGGGYWEAMKGDMTGWYEARKDGRRRHHYRLYCLLDYEAKGMDKPLLVVIDGRDKPFQTTLSPADYAEIRALGEEYKSRNPRSLA
ncbi:hypothetical protein [Amycolatopsis sp. NPDC003861]